MTRKKFFRIMQGLILGLLGYAGYRAARQPAGLSPRGEYVLPMDPPEGISFSGPVIVRKEGNSLRIFSSRCTHLGCRISSSDGERLICPCHGSEYSLDGQPLKGPARSALPELPFQKDPETGTITISLS